MPLPESCYGSEEVICRTYGDAVPGCISSLLCTEQQWNRCSLGWRVRAVGRGPQLCLLARLCLRALVPCALACSRAFSKAAAIHGRAPLPWCCFDLLAHVAVVRQLPHLRTLLTSYHSASFEVGCWRRRQSMQLAGAKVFPQMHSLQKALQRNCQVSCPVLCDQR